MMIQRKTHLLTLAVAVVFYSCIQAYTQKKQSTIVPDTYNPIYSATTLRAKLQSAFTLKNPDTLSQIFLDWNQTIQPNTKAFIEQNDTISAVFDCYKVFYSPLDMEKLGRFEWGNRFNADCKYIAIQNKIFFAVVDSGNFDSFNWSKSRKDSIDNFRPVVNIDSKKVLYLTKEYAKALNEFLGPESTQMGEPDIMSPSHAIGESEKHYEMLRPYVPILHGHWPGSWHLSTHPNIFYILFNPALTEARINFRVGYEGGEAILTRRTNGWSIKESKATWIE